MKHDSTPILSSERADILDILRGFAVLGICISNSVVFSRIAFLPFPIIEKFPTAAVDIPLMLLDIALVDGKFYTLFSLPPLLMVMTAFSGIFFGVVFNRTD